jgi:hypothetical protein
VSVEVASWKISFSGGLAKTSSLIVFNGLSIKIHEASIDSDFGPWGIDF